LSTKGVDGMKAWLFQLKRWVLLVGIFFLGIVANLMIKVVPFKKIMAIMTTDSDTTYHNPSAHEEALLRILVESTERIADVVPWRMKCFENALIMLLFARLLGVELHVDFGVKKEGTSVTAHAWTSSGNRKLTGREECDSYTSVLRRTYRPRKYRIK
jgi:hypothetical protein